MRKAGWAVLFLSVLWSCTRGEEEPPHKQPVVPVTATAAVSRQVHPEIAVTGMVRAKKEAKIGFELAGRLEKVHFEENDPVKAGAVLARLDQTQVRAAVTQAQVGADKAKRDLERIQKLYDDTAIPLFQLQDATSALENAQASLEIARYNLDHTEIRAPFAGRIAFRLVRESELIGPGTPAFVIVDISQVKVEVGVSDSDIGKIHIGDEAQVQVDSYPSARFVGAVTQKAVAADRPSATFKVEITLDNREETLLPGMIAHVVVRAHPHRVVFVPVEALSANDQGQGVLFVLDGSRAYRRVVVVGDVAGREAKILEGIAPGDTVVVRGWAHVEDGDLVRVVEWDNPGSGPDDQQAER